MTTMPFAACRLDRRKGTQRTVIVDPENTLQIRETLQKILGGFHGLVTYAVAIGLGDNVHLWMLLDHIFKTPNTFDGRLDNGLIDHRNFALTRRAPWPDIRRPACRLGKLSEATCETTGPLSALMSAVNTGIPACEAFSMAGPIPFEFTGQTMIAATFWTMKFSICPCCFAKSQSPEVISRSKPFLFGCFLQATLEVPIKYVFLGQQASRQ